MRSTNSKALFLFLSVFFSLQVFAANLYCDYTNGNDANNCTNGTTQLCKTLQRCVNVATGGDTINIANTSAQVLAASISWAGGWTADNSKYTIFQAWNNGGSITIQRPDEASARVAATIDGATLYEFAATPQKLVFKNIKFQNFSKIGDTVALVDNSSVYNCEFLNNNADGGYVISLYLGGTVEGCYFHDNHGFSIIKPQYFGLVANNFIKDNLKGVLYGGNQTVLSSRSGNIIRDNIFVDNQHTSDINTEFDPATITGNTFVSAGSASKIGVTLTNDGATVYNNIFYNYDGASSKPINVAASTVSLVGYNAFYDCNASTYPAQIALDLKSNDVSTTGDPFTDSATDDYTLDPTSGAAAIGAGLGNANSSVDIGAVQSASGGGGGSSEHSYTWVN